MSYMSQIQVVALLLAFWASSALIDLPGPAMIEAATADSRTTSTTTSAPIPNSCSTFYRNTRRSGSFIYGQFTIPVDTKFPKFQIQVKFSRQIQSLTFRQAKAKDISGHREFSIDALEPENGQIVLNSITRLSRSLLSFSRMGLPRVNRIVYNGKTLCAVTGEAIVDETANDETVTLTTHSKPAKKKSSSKVKLNSEKWDISNVSKSNNEFEDDEDEGFDVVV